MYFAHKRVEIQPSFSHELTTYYFSQVSLALKKTFYHKKYYKKYYYS